MSDNGGAFFLGFAVGALVGAAAALLLTPSSGEELRQQIGQKGIELKDQAQKLAGETMTQVEQAAQGARGQIEHVQERGRIVLAENVRKAQQAVQEAQARLAQAEEAPEGAS